MIKSLSLPFLFFRVPGPNTEEKNDKPFITTDSSSDTLPTGKGTEAHSAMDLVLVKIDSVLMLH